MTSSFADLGLSADRVDHLTKMEFTQPTEIQNQAIPQLMSGHDVVGLAQTGTGKTAAFALPILEQIDPAKYHVQALVLTPTRELAMQVSQAMESFSTDSRVYVTSVYGGQSIGQQLSRLKQGSQIVVGTPGRIIDLLDRGGLVLDRLSMMVLDEADEMLNMGFIQDVEKILGHTPDERQTAFFSATMEPAIQKLATRFLKSPVTVSVEPQKASTASIKQVAYVVPQNWSKPRALMPILEMEDPESAIIFVRTRRTAAELTRQLQAAGHSADEYHGDLNQSQRERLLQRFKQRQVRWVVATDIAARGIHVDDLSHVINYELPDNLDSYVHRIGRTGRAGKEGRAIAIVKPLEKYKITRVEKHFKKPVEYAQVPTQAQIAARHLEKLQTRVREAVTSERLASFLPIVSQLSEEYDIRTIAAAALQMAYDQARPAHLRTEDRPSSEQAKPVPKPRLSRRRESANAAPNAQANRVQNKARESANR
ncbi:MAG: ATP-dependent RNA helicase [Leptolyngbya foveolarum]|uniref:RNA helicase n=1 Tax=Leptolyngbya foveolarum TaxID=47253 RepID=A0A2W4U5C2_9CYAN|nr:MAG: ATP-dependent RNA helicase [Leptolyngbya foveolarum]